MTNEERLSENHSDLGRTRNFVCSSEMLRVKAKNNIASIISYTTFKANIFRWQLHLVLKNL